MKPSNFSSSSISAFRARVARGLRLSARRLPWLLGGALGALLVVSIFEKRPTATAVPTAVGMAKRGRLPAAIQPGAGLPRANPAGSELPGRVAEFCRIPETAKDDGQLLLAAAAWCERAQQGEVLAALAQLSTLGLKSEQWRTLSGVLVVRLAMLDPELAANVAIELEVDGERGGYTYKRIAFLRWVESAPTEALARALEIGPAESYERAKLVAAMLGALKEKNPELADALAADLALRGDAKLTGEVRGFQNSRYEELWREDEGPERVLRWIDEFAGSAAHRVAMGERVLRLALAREVAPSVLVSLATRFGEIADADVLENVVAKVGALQPEVALALLHQTKDGPGLAAGWTAFLELRAGAEQPLALERLLGRRDFPQRDEVLGRVAGNLREAAPAVALRVATDIAQPLKRTQALVELALVWIPVAGEPARRALPPEIVVMFDRIAELQHSRVLDVIPGFTPRVSYSAKPAGPE